MPSRQRLRASNQRRAARWARTWKRWAYLLIVISAGIGAVWLLAPAFSGARPGPPTAGDVVEIDGTMGGFSTRTIRAKAGRPLTVRLTSVDTRFHTDGGGRHQFAIDALGVNIIAPPKGTRQATFTPAAPGVYEFYCDICCGGKANPTMVGKLIVEA
jgi:heme/copper-type cytochrome/quinol oxidase subunit 2